MNIEEYQNYCLSKPYTSEGFPFDAHTLVYKVVDKIFTLASIENFKQINVKCDPIKALALRSQYAGVIPAWHMSKKHWNTIILDGFRHEQIYQWIDDSYHLVVAKLPKKIRDSLSIV